MLGPPDDQLPRRLRELPDEGMVVLAHPNYETAAWNQAARNNVGYFLSERFPENGMVLLADLDQIARNIAARKPGD